jgi:hypothetical protein
MTDFGAPPGTFPPPPPPVPPLPSPPPPPFGDRTGPPWEQSGPPATQRYVDTLKAVLMDPTTTFRNMRREGGLANPLTYYLIGVIVAALSQFIWEAALPFGGAGWYGGYGIPGSGLVATIILYPIILLCAFFVASGIYHLMLMLLGGQRYPFETTARTVAYAYGSAMPINIVPICGGLIAGIWSVVALIIGLAQTQETTIGKAAGAVLIPAVLCCGAAILFGAALATMLGIAALGSR